MSPSPDPERRGILFVPSDGWIEEAKGWRVSVVYADEPGHCPTGTWPYHGEVGEKMPWFVPGPSYAEAEAQVAAMNAERGISERDAALGVLKSMGLGRARRR